MAEQLNKKLVKLLVKRGPENMLPNLDVGELAFTTDTNKYFVGSTKGNIELGSKSDMEKISTNVAGQFTDKEKQINQNTVDFVEEVRKHNPDPEQLYARVLNDRNVQVAIPLNGDKAAVYDFIKDANDDFIKFGSVGMGRVGIMEGVTERINYDKSQLTGNWVETYPPYHYVTTVGGSFGVSFEGTGVDVQIPKEHRGGIWDFYLDAELTSGEKDMDSRTGVWVTAHQPNTYTAEVGATITASFHGNTVGFRHFRDNRGGLWEFVIDGNTSNKTIVSTHSSNMASNGSVVLFTGLDNTDHTIVGTFIGDDPNFPPASGAGTSRGWAYINEEGVSGRHTFFYSGRNLDEETKVTVSCYGASSSFRIDTEPLFKGLPYGTHSVLGIFRGDDPNNPPASGAGTSRGWVAYRDIEHINGKGHPNAWTFLVLSPGMNVSTDFEAVVQHSNMEYAITISPANSGMQNQFMPEHSNVPTVFVGEEGYQKIYFDNELVTRTTADSALTSVKTVKIVQKMVAIHPEDNGNVTCDIYCIHTVNHKGAHYKLKIVFRKPTFIGSGYVNMFPFYTDFGQEVITSIGNRYAATKSDGSATYLKEEKDITSSYAIINKTGSEEMQNTVLAMTIDNVSKAMRQGKENRGRSGKPENLVWLEHRDSRMQKIYPHILASHTAQTGEVIETGCTVYIGELPLASLIM